jgi:signal transduction histidine kinase
VKLKTSEIDLIRDLAQGQHHVRLPVRDVNPSQFNEKDQLFQALNKIAKKSQHVDFQCRDLIANVSHELRTPLTAIRAMAENLVDGITPPSQSAFQQILTQAEKLCDLITFMLDTSRIESGVSDLVISEFEIMPFFKDCTEPLSVLEPDKQLEFVINVYPEHLTIRADRDRLAQMMTNLISNSIKFAPPNSQIRLYAARDGKDIVFNIVDSGAGVDPLLKDQIFDRFTTGDQDDYGGTGIGLSIVRWAAQLHGGSVDLVDSPDGTTFEVRLPN